MLIALRFEAASPQSGVLRLPPPPQWGNHSIAHSIGPLQASVILNLRLKWNNYYTAQTPLDAAVRLLRKYREVEEAEK